jgi:hypothetical protein
MLIYGLFVRSKQSLLSGSQRRGWQIIRLRARAEFVGYIEAPNEQAALEAAAKEFAILRRS